MSGIIEFAFNNVPCSSKVKKEGNDQELIQSKPTTYPQSQKEKKQEEISKRARKMHTVSKPNEQLFPKQGVVQLP